MEIDLKDILQKRIETLNKRVEYLSNLDLGTPTLQEFSISDISKTNIEKEETVIGKLYKDLKKINDEAVVYIYEIVDPNIKVELLSKVNHYRSYPKDKNYYATSKIRFNLVWDLLGEERSKEVKICLKKQQSDDEKKSLEIIPSDEKKKSLEIILSDEEKKLLNKKLLNNLYVGSVEKGICLRTKYHLGLMDDSKTTYALQLERWAKKNWKFKFYYITIKDKSMVKDVEAAISEELKPLLGKDEKY